MDNKGNADTHDWAEYRKLILYQLELIMKELESIKTSTSTVTGDLSGRVQILEEKLVELTRIVEELEAAELAEQEEINVKDKRRIRVSDKITTGLTIGVILTLINALLIYFGVL